MPLTLRRDLDRVLTSEEVDSNFMALEDKIGARYPYDVVPNAGNNYSPAIGFVVAASLTDGSALLVEYTLVGKDGRAGRVLQAFSVNFLNEELVAIGECAELIGAPFPLVTAFIDSDEGEYFEIRLECSSGDDGQEYRGMVNILSI